MCSGKDNPAMISGSSTCFSSVIPRSLLRGASLESGLLGGALGAGAAGGSYEYHLKRQKDRVEEDFKASKIEFPEAGLRFIAFASVPFAKKNSWSR
jgi:hypothetical protein